MGKITITKQLRLVFALGSLLIVSCTPDFYAEQAIDVAKDARDRKERQKDEERWQRLEKKLGTDVPIAASSELEKIKSRVENSLVTFKNKDIQVSGKTTRALIRQTSKSEDSGVASRIEWDDGVVSSILFLENSNVRIWVKGVEYGGKWFWSPSGTLQVQTDQGSYYSWE
ncbi:hypothetical protein [Anabaena sp. PCC 7108]|uniref:hypothetical protein n=1 Tax=Anabaena sp. PCC 7108 TaxID=163908 RepID=UPI0003713B52|nr:hypothetical protein [Anabaena sp. PCC 7108]